MHSGANYAAEGDASPYSRSSTRRRNPMACLICRKRKIKCEFNNGPDVCDHCRSKNTKCTVLSVAQEEAFKAWGYTDESLASMSNAELDSLQRQLPHHNSVEHTEPHPTGRLLHNDHGSPSSPHPLSSTGQDRSRAYDPGNRAPPSPYNNSAHNIHTASRTCSTNHATVPINTPHPHVHPHHQSSIHPNYSGYTNPSPNHQVLYQIPATGGALAPHHAVGDHHQVHQLHPNTPAHTNAIQSQSHANYPGQADYSFQTAQQPGQGQMTQPQYGGYPATMTLGFPHDVSQWRG